jgi:hypothetical protein
MIKIRKLTQNDIPKYIKTGIENAPCILYGIHDKDFVWICKEKKCDFDYIKENNINHIEINGTGSTIVCAEGDLDFGFFGSEEFCYKMLNKVSEYLSKLLTGGEIINNDFMYNGNKYAAATRIDLGDCYYIGVHVSNNINKDLINNVCLKKSYKTPEKLPKALTEKDIKIIFEGEII